MVVVIDGTDSITIGWTDTIVANRQDADGNLDNGVDNTWTLTKTGTSWSVEASHTIWTADRIKDGWTFDKITRTWKI